MFPVKYDYLSDQIDAFPLQVVTHRGKGILRMKVSLGDITNTSWKDKMNIDHDLEVVNPWFYSTYVIDDDITVNFSPGEKCAIYKINFPTSKQKKILIQGSSAMKGTVNSGAFFKLEENKKANERCQKGLNEKRKN
jgi:putative alpha-1,2-mannosidase